MDNFISKQATTGPDAKVIETYDRVGDGLSTPLWGAQRIAYFHALNAK